MVARSNNNANANGGVSYANANNDSANVNANYGSRLAYNLCNMAYNDGDVLINVVPMRMSLSKSSKTLEN